ncbi:MAG: hypothetical protein U9N34_07140, partial [Candidatus Cloacimonadota bacterium]|nr:hypothetical protein [Candidatus Cloacimonadota bacterium]
MKESNQAKWELSEALVSAVIHLAQVGGVTKKDVVFVHRFIRQIIGESTPAGIIEERIMNPLSLRESCYIIKDSLIMSDKKNLLLILLSLLYLEKEEFLLVGSLQVVSFVDLLMINVDFYNEILDIIEKDTNFLKIETQQLIDELYQSKFKNRMIWGSKDCDVYLHKSMTEKALLFWIINNQVFVMSLDENKEFFIEAQKLKRDAMHLLSEDKKLIFKSDEEEFEFTHADIVNIYEDISSGKNITIQNTFGLNNDILKQRSGHLFITSEVKRL